jgi:hypothetical protein
VIAPILVAANHLTGIFRLLSVVQGRQQRLYGEILFNLA